MNGLSHTISSTEVDSLSVAARDIPARNECGIGESTVVCSSRDFESCKDEDVPTKACENRAVVVYVALQKSFFCIVSELFC